MRENQFVGLGKDRLEQIYTWAYRMKREACPPTPEGETRFYRLWDLQVAAWEAIKAHEAQI